mgnify:CR=1 FL=1
MAELKTKVNDQSVTAFLEANTDEKRRKDCFTVLEMMKKATGSEPKMWGDSIVGFGSYHYKYASGQEGDWLITGFSPRKQALTLYLMSGFDNYESILSRLGKFKTGKSCLYIKKLDDIDVTVLQELIDKSVHALSKR